MKKQRKQRRKTSDNCQCYIQVYIYYSCSGNLCIWYILLQSIIESVQYEIWFLNIWGLWGPYYLENVCLQQQELASPSKMCLAKPLEAWQFGFPWSPVVMCRLRYQAWSRPSWAESSPSRHKPSLRPLTAHGSSFISQKPEAAAQADGFLWLDTPV